MSQATIGAIIAGLSFAAYWKGVFRTLSSIGIFLAVLLIGINGWIIAKVAGILAWVTATFGPTVANATGISLAGIGAALVVFIGFLVIHAWAPRNPARKSTFWLAGLLACLIVAGATPFAALNNLPSQVGQVSQVTGR